MVKYIDKNLAFEFFPERNEYANKGSFLKVLNIAGSNNYSGAAFLSSLSSLRVGAGFVTLACPKSIISRFSANMSEITYKPLNETENGTINENNDLSFIDDYPIISVGCGLSVNENTQKFFTELLKKINQNHKLIIDADAINILAKMDYKKVLKNSIFTPHPKELSRLLNVSLEEVLQNREKYARITSQKYDCITVLKGKNTIITDGDEIYINTTGNSALAKAGSGDVLTGILSGLLSQHLPILKAAILGVYLHGLAGDLASEDLTKYSVLASDVIDYITFAIKEILSEE